MKKRGFTLFLVPLLLFIFAEPAGFTAQASGVLPFTGSLDYSLSDNWLYDGAYPENGVDVFMVAPTVDTLSYSNSTMTEAYKKRWLFGHVDG